jgi:hypothetical protein
MFSSSDYYQSRCQKPSIRVSCFAPCRWASVPLLRAVESPFLYSVPLSLPSFAPCRWVSLPFLRAVESPFLSSVPLSLRSFTPCRWVCIPLFRAVESPFLYSLPLSLRSFTPCRWVSLPLMLNLFNHIQNKTSRGWIWRRDSYRPVKILHLCY